MSATQPSNQEILKLLKSIQQQVEQISEFVADVRGGRLISPLKVINLSTHCVGRMFTLGMSEVFHGGAVMLDAATYKRLVQEAPEAQGNRIKITLI